MFTYLLLGIGAGADFRAQELCESRGGHPELPVPNSPYVLCGRKATLNCSVYGLCGHKATLNCSISVHRSCVKVEVAVLGSLSLTVLMASVDVRATLNLN